MSLAKYGVKEVCDVILYDLLNDGSFGKPLLFLDTLKMNNLENTAESSNARGGKGNPKILTWDFNRESQITMQDALMSPKSIALLTGNETTVGVAEVHKRQVLKAIVGATGTTKVTVAKTPITGSVTVYKVSDSTEVDVNSVSTMDVIFDDADVAVGTEVEVYYKHATSAEALTITITSDSFPAYVGFVGLTVVRNAKSGKDEPFQMIIHKAKIQPNFTLTFQADGDPSVFDMNLEVFRRDADTEMIRLIKYED